MSDFGSVAILPAAGAPEAVSRKCVCGPPIRTFWEVTQVHQTLRRPSAPAAPSG